MNLSLTTSIATLALSGFGCVMAQMPEKFRQ
jgi:hypothetical protein